MTGRRLARIIKDINSKPYTRRIIRFVNKRGGSFGIKIVVERTGRGDGLLEDEQIIYSRLLRISRGIIAVFTKLNVLLIIHLAHLFIHAHRGLLTLLITLPVHLHGVPSGVRFERVEIVGRRVPLLRTVPAVHRGISAGRLPHHGHPVQEPRTRIVRHIRHVPFTVTCANVEVKQIGFTKTRVWIPYP